MLQMLKMIGKGIRDCSFYHAVHWYAKANSSLFKSL